MGLPCALATGSPVGSHAVVPPSTGESAAGEFLIIRALELTQAVVLAPLQYSMMIWSTIWGWLIWSPWCARWSPTFTWPGSVAGLLFGFLKQRGFRNSYCARLQGIGLHSATHFASDDM